MLAGLAFSLVLGLGSPALGQEADEDEGTSSGVASESTLDSERTPPEKVDDTSLRKAPTRRKKGGRSDFDPKVFEARGRELQGEYYEIASFAKAPAWSSAPADVATTAPETSSSRNWFLWGGAAGLTAVVAGAAGYLFLEKADPVQPISVQLNDKP